jgi:hypothetical protein
MQRISSRATFWFKRVFPTIWFGFLALFSAVALFANVVGKQPQVPFFLVVPALMAAIGYFVMKKLVFNLADEVWDDGSALIVKNKGQDDRIALANIINVSYSPLINPPLVTLMLRQPSVFGTEISFSAPVRFMPFTKSPLLEDLIRRVDAARRK